MCSDCHAGQLTWSKSFQRGGVTGVRMLNSYASGWLGTRTMVSLVPSIVCPAVSENVSAHAGTYQRLN